jgi:hypothetical protein
MNIEPINFDALVSTAPLPDGSTLVYINREANKLYACKPPAEKRNKYPRPLRWVNTLVVHQTAVSGGFAAGEDWQLKGHKLVGLLSSSPNWSDELNEDHWLIPDPAPAAGRLFRYETQETYHGLYSQRDRVSLNQFSARWRTFHGHESNARSVGWAIDGLFNGKSDTDTLDVDGATRALIHFVGCVRRELVASGLPASQLRYIEAHRQHSDQRGRDPGPEIWSQVVLPVAKVLGLETTERTTGTGKVIPDSWKDSSEVIAERAAKLESELVRERAHLDGIGDEILIPVSPKNRALNLIARYGGIDGAHHKQWVIDQVVRALTGDEYDAWVTEVKAGEDGPETYEWDTGRAP